MNRDKIMMPWFVRYKLYLLDTIDGKPLADIMVPYDGDIILYTGMIYEPKSMTVESEYLDDCKSYIINYYISLGYEMASEKMILLL